MMLAKLLNLSGLFLCLMAFGQAKYTIEQAESSTDVKVIASFIKDQPNHPKVPALKRKIASLMGGNPTETPAKSPTTKGKTTRYVKNDNKKTAELLTHMFSNDVNKKEAYIAVTNKSKCDIELSIVGKKSYTLSIPTGKKNFILLDKGPYKLSAKVCEGRYEVSKTLTKDTEITLGN